MIAFDRILRVLKKRPDYIIERIGHELTARSERWRGPRRARHLSPGNVAGWAGADADVLWDRLAGTPGPVVSPPDANTLERLAPGELDRLRVGAARVLDHRVDLLGSGEVHLGADIDWHTDFKSGLGFGTGFCRDIAYSDLGRPSDVKVPWELSRMQWLIPAGQLYQLASDERYALEVRKILESWWSENPYAFSVNWACTMDVALRAIVWVWLFDAFKDSLSWRDTSFRARFLSSLYLHGDFVSRHLEKSDINGNHYTADAAGLVFIGLFFAGIGKGDDWAQTGWEILEKEISLQIHGDGVDFESSVPYHRLVAELFLYPAIFRLRRGLPVSQGYGARLVAMARFVEAYSRTDGSVPLWGDADDARTLPFRHGVVNDHRYLIGLIATLFEPGLLTAFSGSRAEVLWMLGAKAASALQEERLAEPASAAFAEGGFYILRDRRNHVFVDCGDIGLAGRGGHGHNDLLACEIALRGEPLIVDCGAFLYTADYRERNAFRSTAYHNTPQVDGEEINRFVRPDYLWTLHNDAAPYFDRFECDNLRSVFAGSHDGYARLPDPVGVQRTITLDHAADAVLIEDEIRGQGDHLVTIPWHLAPGVQPRLVADDSVELIGRSGRFVFKSISPWRITIAPARVSASYGVVEATSKIVLTARGTNLTSRCRIAPA